MLRSKEQDPSSTSSGLQELTARTLAPDIQDILRQVSNYPADIRIEEWMFDQFPEMRCAQRAALVQQLKKNELVLVPRVESISARTVYQANVAINCAFAQLLALLLGEPASLDPYPNQSREEARKLLREVAAQRDPSHLGDVAISKKWSEILGLSGWFRWVRLGDAPDARQMFSNHLKSVRNTD